MEEFRSALGQNLVASRKRRFPGDTQKSFAKRIGVGRATLQRMESGDLSVSIGIHRAGELAVRYEQSITRRCAFRHSPDYQAIDDHERNFSLINCGNGYKLSPAYDMVPSLSRGAYHAASFGYLPYPPLPGEAAKANKIFGLNKTEIQDCADQILSAIGNWENHAEKAGVSEHDAETVAKAFPSF